MDALISLPDWLTQFTRKPHLMLQSSSDMQRQYEKDSLISKPTTKCAGNLPLLVTSQRFLPNLYSIPVTIHQHWKWTVCIGSIACWHFHPYTLLWLLWLYKQTKPTSWMLDSWSTTGLLASIYNLYHTQRLWCHSSEDQVSILLTYTTILQCGSVWHWTFTKISEL
jgi:hypothetical protein